jgi:hypothetical protein
MTLRQAAGRHPLAAAALCAGLQFALTILILDAGKAFAPPAAWGQVKLAAFASTVILPLLLVQALGLWRAIGVGRERLRPPPFFYACLVPALMFAALGVRPEARPDVGGEVLMQLVNAFGEELLFRGVIFALLLRLPVWQAIVANGLLFGAMHLIHGVMDGDWARAAVWALMSACAGMMFTAARYRTGSLWLLVLLHMVLNLASIYSNVEFVAGPEVNLLVQRATKVVELVLAAWVMLGAVQRPASRAARSINRATSDGCDSIDT